SLPATVARELWEETGYQVKLGKLVGKVTYPVQGRTKVVYYWLAQVLSGEFIANEEADELVWMPIADARERVTYKLDEDVLDKALKRLQLMPETLVLYVRHARAHDRKTWSGDDNLRPLDKRAVDKRKCLSLSLLPTTPLRSIPPCPIGVCKPLRRWPMSSICPSTLTRCFAMMPG